MPYDSETSAKYAEHLRSVHFVLVTTCLVLMIGSFVRHESEIDRAVSQSDTISKVVRQWRLQPGWLDEYARRQLGESGMPAPIVMRALKDIRIVHNRSNPHHHLLVAPFFTLQEGRFAPYEPETAALDDVRRDLRLEVPATLSAFKELWEELKKPVKVFAPTGAPTHEVFRSPGGGWTLIELPTPESTGIPAGRYGSSLVLAAYRDPGIAAKLRDNGFAAEWLTHGFQEVRSSRRLAGASAFVVAPVPVGVVSRVDAQVAMASWFGTSWTGGRFADAFPELDEITQEYQEITLPTLRVVLKGEKTRAGERFELFGAKVPTTEIVRWGVPALIAVQLYLWLHLGRFRRRTEESRICAEVPWIGLYRSIPAYVVTVLSAAVVPLGLVAYLSLGEGLRVIDPTLRTIVGVLFSLAVVLAVATVAEFVRLWRLGFSAPR